MPRLSTTVLEYTYTNTKSHQPPHLEATFLANLTNKTFLCPPTLHICVSAEKLQPLWEHERHVPSVGAPILPQHRVSQHLLHLTIQRWREDFNFHITFDSCGIILLTCFQSACVVLFIWKKVRILIQLEVLWLLAVMWIWCTSSLLPCESWCSET